MSRARYYFSFTPSWQQTPLARWILSCLGAAFISAGTYFALAGEDLGFVAAQLLFHGAVFFAQASGLTERYFGLFVDISLGKVAWRLTDPSGALRPQYRKVALAQVSNIEVGLLRIDFTMSDGSVCSMPLGELPYEVVRAIKERFEGEHSLAGATMRLGAGVS